MSADSPCTSGTSTPTSPGTRPTSRCVRPLENRGAYVMGRNMYGPVRGEWEGDWRGWWGENPPYHAPVFVLTHHPHEPIEMQGGTTFHFVTDGFDAAYAAAWDEAFATRKPVVLEAYTDPEVPTLPPHISFAQAMGFATSTPRDAAVVGMVKAAVGHLVETFLPHKK